MRLGNSQTNRNSSERVKRYIKLTGDEVLSTEGVIKTAVFNSWFHDNYYQLIDRIVVKYEFDEDVYHDTYIKIFEAVGYKGLDIESIDNYFFRAYYTNLFLKKTMGERLYFCQTDQELYSYVDNNNDTNVSQKAWFAYNFEKIVSELPQFFDSRQIAWFKLSAGIIDEKTESPKKYNYTELAFMYNVKVHSIQRSVSAIKKHINKFYSNLYSSRL